jgi:HlyD family secretion protein
MNMHDDTAEDGSVQTASLRAPVVAGLAVCLATLGGLGAFAAVTNISGAVIAPGSLIVESRTKKVQHAEGGIVGSIRVDDGSQVREGDVLISLDETKTRAQLAIVMKQISQYNAKLARLRAERDGAAEPVFGPSGTADEADAIATERALFASRLRYREAKKVQLNHGLEETRKEIEGLEADIGAIDRQYEIASPELANLRDLFEKKHLAITRVLDLEREVASLTGRKGQRVAEVAKAHEQISQTEIELIQVDTEMQNEVLKDIESTEGQLATLAEKRTTAEDRLSRMDIRAPQSGIVHELAIHTVGGVVKASETLMLIVPQQDRLVVEAQASPHDIDQLSVGQPARVRFSNFNVRTTPELDAKVTRVSADAAEEPETKKSYYAVRLEIPDKELKKLGDVKLLPGMRVTAFIMTSERSVMSYLTKPVEDMFAGAMRER